MSKEQVCGVCLEPDYAPPSRKHLSKLLFAKYERAIPLLKGKLSRDASAVAITSNIWTSNQMEAYISVTAHFISPQWQMESYILQTKHFPERHTGVNIAGFIEEVVKSFGIDSISVAVVHDTC